MQNSMAIFNFFAFDWNYSFGQIWSKQSKLFDVVLMLSWECTNFLKQQKQPPEVFRKKGVLKNFAIFTGKPVAFLVRT